MDQFRLRTATLVVAAALIGLGVGLATGLFEDGGRDAPAGTTPVGRETIEAPEASEGPNKADPPAGPELPPVESDPEGLSPGPSGPAPSSDEEIAVAAAARAYVEAIDERSGRKVCRAFAPGALAALDLPAERSTCPASLDASFGYRGKRGQPVWDSSEMTQDLSAETDGDSARVVATVFTKYADVREPTIEDDIIYLARPDDRWLVLKPSATLYRAVGIADVPLDALQPPD